MLKFQDLFRDLGITDIFWSHAVKGQSFLPDHPDIRLHPFPLYPVQAKDFAIDPLQPKKHLFSFVGAKANHHYLTDARNIIIDELKNSGGLVVGNDIWHYNKVVYDHQVRGLVNKPDGLVDTEQSEAFRSVLAQSVFSLCPSGTGPNSIRLWESIGLGAIPVIIADTLALPGDPVLWQEAAVFCKEDRTSILALPQRLKAIHADPVLLKRKRFAMAQIWDLYGSDNFVYDIRKLMIERYQDARIENSALAQQIYEPVICSVGSSLNALTTEILVSPATAAAKLRDERDQILDLLVRASASQQAIFARALASRGLKEVWEA